MNKTIQALKKIYIVRCCLATLSGGTYSQKITHVAMSGEFNLLNVCRAYSRSDNDFYFGEDQLDVTADRIVVKFAYVSYTFTKL